VADLVRLMTLAEDNRSDQENIGKYLLHVYQGDPSHYVAMKKKDGKRREWLEALYKPGRQELEFSLVVHHSGFDRLKAVYRAGLLTVVAE